MGAADPLPGTVPPVVLAYQGTSPRFASVPRCGTGAAVAGRVTLGIDAVLQPFAVLRADGHFIEAGDRLYLGTRSTVHIAHETLPARIGSDVTVGDNAVVHACSVADGCVIEDGVAVLDGAAVGEGTIVAAGSVVFSRAVLPPGHWCGGSPAVAVRPLAAGELLAARDRIRSRRVREHDAAAQKEAFTACATQPRGYVASTVMIAGMGPLSVAEGSSVWFGCVLHVGSPGIEIEEGANVQDNSVLRCVERRVTIGRNATIGHNVAMEDCTVGERALVGMCSTLAPGTVLMPDSMLAAGSRTQPGQVLESDWLWAGRPASRVSKMNARWKELIALTASTYRVYAAEFAAQQALPYQTRTLT